MRLYLQEWKQNKKQFLIWTLGIVLVNVGCILLYDSLEDTIQGIADTYANMGAVSAAIGMDKLSLATLEGYYGTEIATIYNLCAALFSALLGIGMLSKEENGHTAEFLNTLPLSRTSIYVHKYLALISILIVFNLVNIGCNLFVLQILGDFSRNHILLYHLACFLMQLELMTICYLISACTKKIQIGIGLGLTIILYIADMMCRIIPDIEKLKYITPFYYSSAADTFTTGKLDTTLISIGMSLALLSFIAGLIIYKRKDLSV